MQGCIADAPFRPFKFYMGGWIGWTGIRAGIKEWESVVKGVGNGGRPGGVSPLKLGFFLA